MDALNAPGMLKGRPGPEDGPEGTAVVIDNRTELPDAQVREAIMAHWVENAALQFGTPSSFQLYAANQGSGSMLARSPFRTPSNVIEEIKLARQVADHDDDIASVIAQAVHTAYKDGMQNQHEDEPTLRLFNRICRDANMDLTLKELHREYLITSQVNTVQLFTRSRLNFTPSGTEEKVQAQLTTPLIGVLPAENIRVTSMDVFGTGDLAYEVTDVHLKDWLDKFFDKGTSNAIKNKMREEQPVLSALFIGAIEYDWNDQDVFAAGKKLYKLNPRMVHRTTMPKGSAAYPRPRMTANFALLEAKRLLNIMDYALLQGGTNYIVIARQGSDQIPAQQPEIDNLTDQIRAASRTGVLVGDHRLAVDIITPKLDELLNPAKRKLIGRKLAMAILCIPEQVTPDPGNEGARSELEFIANTVTSDRRDIKRHVERFTYEEVVTRNPSAFRKGPPSLWFPKVVLSGVKDFFANVMAARDRGDIPRQYAVEVLGYDYEAGVAQRKREKAAGHDELMVPGAVPFSSPDGPPNDNPSGRPPGSSSNNGRPGAPDQNRPGAAPQRQLLRRPTGEAIRAEWLDDRVVRVGEVTAAVMEQYPDHAVGRITEFERTAAAQTEMAVSGPICVIPVNTEYEVTEIRAFRLDEGLSMIVGQREQDGAIVAKALAFREPHFDLQRAEGLALRWGFITATVAEEYAELEHPEVASAEEIATAIAAQARTAVGGLDVAAVIASASEVFAQVIGRAVAEAVANQPAPVIQIQSPAPAE